MAELQDWMEDHECPNIFYGPRDEGETPRQAFEDCLATYGDDEWGLRRAEEIWMRPIKGEEALDFFDGNHDSGWCTCGEGVKDAVPAWEIEVYL